MKSIRRYLVSRVLLGAAVILGGATCGVYIVVARSLERQFDTNLADRIQALASILFQTEDELSFEFSDELMPEYESPTSPSYFELRLEGGLLVEASNSLGDDTLPLPLEPGPQPAFWSATLPDGRAGRFAVQLVQVHHVFPEEGPERPEAARVVIAVARGTEGLRATRSAVLFQALGTFAGLMAMLALLTHLSVRRGLEPARKLGEALDRVRVDDLPPALAVGPLPEELEPMARKAGALISRVADAFERERRTTADIAHELRTPISEMLTVSEVALRLNGHSAAEEGALSTIRDIASHMGRSVSTLLKLAWLESGGDTFERADLELASLVREVCRALASTAEERQVTVRLRGLGSSVVEGDRDVLRIVVSNLLGNALGYAPRGSSVDVDFERLGEGWRLTFENPAPDLQPEDLDVLTEPFWRKDRARGDRRRFGLGLALSSALAAKTGLELEFELKGDRFRASLLGSDRARCADA